MPPALLIHGTADTTVYPRNSTNLAAAWRAAGAPVELKLYPDVGHIDVVAALSGLLSGRAPTRTDVLRLARRALSQLVHKIAGMPTDRPAAA